MSSITEFYQEKRTSESAQAGGPATIVGAFAVFVLIASVWIGLFFGVLQPWLDGAL
jgi:hypothetical protein